MATLTRSESVVSTDEADFEPIDSKVMDEETVTAIQEDDIDTIRNVDAAKLALPTIAKSMALHEACEHGSMQVIRYLVEESGHDIDCRDASEWTPLHYAAVFQSEDGACGDELVHYLLSHGADASAECEDGCTPLDAHNEEVDADDADEPTFVSRLLASVAAASDYEAWAKVNAREQLYTSYIESARPSYVKNALRHEWTLLQLQAERRSTTTAPSAASFVLGQQGGNAVFAHLLPYLA